MYTTVTNSCDDCTRSLDNVDFIGIFQPVLLNETNKTCFAVLIRDDLQPEEEEEFRVYLLTLDSAGQTVVYNVFVTVTIMDDEGGWLL